MFVGDCGGVLSTSPVNSPTDQHMASPVDQSEDNYNHEEMNWDDVETQQEQANYYFRVTSVACVGDGYNNVDHGYVRCCR